MLSNSLCLLAYKHILWPLSFGYKTRPLVPYLHSSCHSVSLLFSKTNLSKEETVYLCFPHHASRSPFLMCYPFSCGICFHHSHPTIPAHRTSGFHQDRSNGNFSVFINLKLPSASHRIKASSLLEVIHWARITLKNFSMASPSLGELAMACLIKYLNSLK